MFSDVLLCCVGDLQRRILWTSGGALVMERAVWGRHKCHHPHLPLYEPSILCTTGGSSTKTTLNIFVKYLSVSGDSAAAWLALAPGSAFAFFYPSAPGLPFSLLLSSRHHHCPERPQGYRLGRLLIVLRDQAIHLPIPSVALF